MEINIQWHLQFLELLLQGTPLRSDKDTQLKQQLLKFNIQGNQGNVLSTLLSKEYLKNICKTQKINVVYRKNLKNKFDFVIIF